MNPADDNEKGSPGGPRLQEVLFSIINSDSVSGEILSGNNTGTLLDVDSNGISLLTRVRVQPGNILRLDHRGTSRIGVVMWSVESSNNCRIQVRFI